MKAKRLLWWPFPGSFLLLHKQSIYFNPSISPDLSRRVQALLLQTQPSTQAATDEGSAKGHNHPTDQVLALWQNTPISYQEPSSLELRCTITQSLEITQIMSNVSF